MNEMLLATAQMGVKEVLERLFTFLSSAHTLVSTAESKYLLYGMAVLELDHAIACLAHAMPAIEEDSMKLGNCTIQQNFRQWAKKIEKVARQWKVYDDAKGNDGHVLHVNMADFKGGIGSFPADGYAQFRLFHGDVQALLQEKTKTLTGMLIQLQQNLDVPSAERLVAMFDSLEAKYMQDDYPEDCAKFESRFSGVPKCNYESELRKVRKELKKQLDDSCFLACVEGDDSSALKTLCGSEKEVKDKESVARYIFGNRKAINNDMINSFFRFLILGRRIEEALASCQKERKEQKMKQKLQPESQTKPHSGVKKQGDKGTVLKPTSATFVFKDEESAERLQLLLKGMQVKAINGTSLVGEKTIKKDIADLFSGEPAESLTIRWTGSKQHLAYFFKTIVKKHYVRMHKGETVWMMVRSHFVDADGKQFGDDLHDQQAPRGKSKKVMDALIEILNPNLTVKQISDKLSKVLS